MNVSLTDLFASMGLFAKGIVAVLMIMSVFSLTIMIQKWWNLMQAQKQTRKFAPEFSQFLEEDNLGEAVKLAEGYKKSHVARVLGGRQAAAGNPPPNSRQRVHRDPWLRKQA